MDRFGKWLVSLSLWMSVPVGLPATDSVPLLKPPLLISSTRFDLNDGLPNRCLREAFVDSKGRLWLNFCENTASDLGLDFFQYDGEQSIFYDLSPPRTRDSSQAGAHSTHRKPNWSIVGETTDGFLFGVNDIDLHNIIFFWNPDTGERHFHFLEKGTRLLNLVPDQQGGVLLLSLRENRYQVAQWQEGEITWTESLALDFDNKENFPQFFFPYPFVLQGRQAWFFHGEKGMVSLDFSSRQMQFIPWNNWPGLTLEIDDKLANRWDMVTQKDNHLLLYLGHTNGFFTLNTTTRTLSPAKGLNQRLIESVAGELNLIMHMASDRKQNLFLLAQNIHSSLRPGEPDRFRALLLDPAGNIYDYQDLIIQFERAYGNEVLSGVDIYATLPPKNISSPDFQEKMFFALEDGLFLYDLQPDLGISNFSYPFGLRAITPIDDRNLLINTDVTNIQYNLESGSFQGLPGEDFRVNTMSDVLPAKDGKVWMSQEMGNLLRYDLTTYQYDTIPVGVQFDKFQFIDEEEVVLFSWDQHQLYKFDLPSRTVTNVFEEGVPFSVGGKVNELLLAKDSSLWVGAQTGLWHLDLKNGIEVISHTFQGNNILCLHEAEGGRLWLGTAQAGVLLFDPDVEEYKQIARVNGLSNNTVAGILADDAGNRWISTFNGITILSPAGEVKYILTQENGLLNDEYNRLSYARLPGGRLAFGGIRGLDILDPDRILQVLAQGEPIQIYLTRLEFFDKQKGENSILQGSLYPTDPIRIPSTHRYLKLDFALSDYHQLEEQTFSYRIIPEGSSAEQQSAIPWADLGALSELTLTDLPVGDHRVQVHGLDPKAKQVIATLEIPIHVEEFFYRTWWFYLLCTLPFAFGVSIWIRRIRTQKKRLEIEVDRRTAEIQQDKATIERQAVRLQELDEAKTRFFTNISHEFRTPLTVILGMAEQIEHAERPKRLIQRNAKLVLRLVNQILELRKLESGSLTTRYIQADVVAYLQYIIESFHSLAEEKGVSVRLDAPYEELILDYDPEKLLHIVSNLLINSIKFTPSGGEVTVTVRAFPDGDEPFYQCSVSDTGTGIPDDKLPHIFDRFYQLDNGLSRTGSGTGIGLTLVKELVNALNGEISVESEAGKGTNFRVQLPLTNRAEPESELPDLATGLAVLPETLPATVAQPSGKPAQTALPSLLIVEDNPDVREYLITCLEEDYTLFLAADGQEGIDHALEKVPDIIISDVMMPRVDGFDLCNALKTDVRTSHIPIVLLTAKADLDSRITGLERGADAYLAKPFDKRELKVQLDNLLVLRQRLHERYTKPEGMVPTKDRAIQQEDEFVLELRQTILDHVREEEFGVQELCKRVGMSRTQLHNKIKSLTNRPTSHFIRRVRIQKAIELMRDPELNIGQIALEVGIPSLPYFSRLFSQETGLSPSKYLEKIRSEP